MTTFRTAHVESSSFYVELVVTPAAVLYVNIESPAQPIAAPVRAAAAQAIKRHGLRHGAPSAIAAELSASLSSAAGPEWVLYSAVLAEPQRVEVSVAGPYRVHLIQAGRLAASTREHILRYDDAPPDWPAGAKDNIDLDLQGDIITRSLGKAASQGPEVTIWTPHGPYRIVSCSSEAHQSRPELSYATTLDIHADLAAWSGSAGSVFVLECS